MSSIRQIFPIVLSIQITVAVGITGWISFNSSERAVQKLTRELCSNLNYRVELKINTYLKESVRINQALTTALLNGSVNPNNIGEVQREIFNKSRELNSQNILFYGNESGTMVGIERQNDSNFLLRIREDNVNPNRPTFELSNNGIRGKVIMNEVYDHRTRPWYIDAKRSGKAIWSSIFVSTTDGELTTTKATPIYNANGGLQGVAGINISLKQIKQFMLQTRPSDKWNVFLIEGNGNLVATTSDVPVFERNGNAIKRFELAQSKDPRLQDAGLALREQLGSPQSVENLQVVEFNSNGEKYILSMQNLDEDLELDWSVGIIVPKSIFMQEIDTNNRVTLVIIVIMLGVNILIGLAIASWLLRPIKNLMTAAKEIEEESFNPEELASVAQRQDELGQMARVFQEMGSTIAERQNGMKSQLSKLRAEKDEAKKAAIASQMGQTNSVESLLSRSRALRIGDASRRS
ncbi:MULTISPECIES: cache domain-containing protein [Pseudanabaena]|uniref:PDC sensor domain-containing protein n=1 Tax=Pseudanabaena TaxID=1152 RepID=UPI00247968E8|nr:MULTISPECIES: cache domain-containing protein [Pseudanabaena]MEA5487744.1 cache domain-containing protein [Pseudanabaena sp. CCNP1317]WGS72517.1 cache domain-containing protein [Pseudanabaena galeata CCNP1313]